MRQTPVQPWSRVGIYLFHYAAKTYLVVYDATSSYPEVEELHDSRARTVVAEVASIFARHGISLEVCSDNEPQFVSKELKDFATNFDFRHVTSSPRFPRANGLAEKGVQIIKRLLKKTHHANENFFVGLLIYRTSPLESGTSPAEILMGRRLLSRLPDFTPGTMVEDRKHQQNHMRGSQLPPLRPGNIVRIDDGNTWCTKAKVEGMAAPRSYNVRPEDNRVFRRNRQHLLPTSEDFSPTTVDLDDDGSITVNQQQASPRDDQPSSAAAQSTTGVQDMSPTEFRPRRSTRTRRPPDRLMYT
ncbi:uncharacterized protein LOC135389337 [Ornithodoros turicata]|uniref:uncharacterized protein LOC135389337 n=1 Tax=Ornithodoros turicata TaxID=34597 RepID=UPI003138AABB